MKESKLFLKLILAGILLVASCKGKDAGQKGPAYRAFPEVSVPAMYSDPEDVMDYVLKHFWDGYLDTTSHYLCDSTHIGGVEQKIVASELASYLSILQTVPLDKALSSVRTFFSRLEAYQQADTSSNVFGRMTEAVSYYLYDPNSEIRNEEIYLPFVEGLSVSPLVPQSRKEAYLNDVRLCSINRLGTPAANFRFVDMAGRIHTLYGEKAPMTLVIFINPGCHACGEAVAAFGTDEVKAMTQEGKLKILGIYIDKDIAAWKAEKDHVPAHWISGYDPDFVIREDRIYSVRAIPSIYILDSEKNVLAKDVPVDQALSFINNIL